MSYARNYCVARGTLAASSNVAVYAVPQGYNLILKSMVFWPTSTVSGSVVVAIWPPAGSFYVTIMNAALTNSQPTMWSNWMVLNERDYVTAQPGPESCNYWISGALLEAGAPLPAAVLEEVLVSGPPPQHGPPASDPQRISIV